MSRTLVNRPLCSLCNNFQRKPRDYRFAFDCNPDQLDYNADIGCYYCSLLRDGIVHASSKFGGLKLGQHHIYVSGGNIDGGGKVEVEVFADGDLTFALEYFATKWPGLMPGMRVLPRLSGDTSSEVSIAWAQKMLDSCRRSHESCGQKDVPKLPTRVLDVGTDIGETTVKLHASAGEEAEYVCLSHCWGKSRGVTTEKNTIKERSEGIIVDDLPQTFKDAVIITRKLGFQYLWIDSLCIVQDDLDDWRRESANMASIYRLASITISATKSASDSGGCFPIDAETNSDRRMRETSDVFVREKIYHLGEGRCKAPLLRRGWAYQERLLSPRVLHFCERELAWECQEQMTCECRCSPQVQNSNKVAKLVNLLEAYRKDKPPPRGIPVSQRGPRSYDELHTTMFHYLKSRGIDMNEYENGKTRGVESLRWNPIKQSDLPASWANPAKDIKLPVSPWRKIVSEYSALDLTKESDRLTAIAGVALQMSKFMKRRYYAGLWGSTLTGDLLWRLDEAPGTRAEHRLRNPSIPSWSWAAASGKVAFLTEPVSVEGFNVLEFNYVPVSALNAYGEVAHASLKISATLTPATFRAPESAVRDVFNRHIQIEGAEYRCPPWSFVADYDTWEEADTVKKAGIYLLGNFYTERSTISLVVSPVGKWEHHGQVRTYRRVGIFENVQTEFELTDWGAPNLTVQVGGVHGSFGKRDNEVIILV